MKCSFGSSPCDEPHCLKYGCAFDEGKRPCDVAERSRPATVVGELPPRATVDFETRSAASLKDCGAYRYAADPTTQVLCMAYRVPGMAEPAIWHPAFPEYGIEEAPPPLELFAWILGGGLVEAHNSQFERAVWTQICVPRLGWPAVPAASWRCSAAKAAAFALPRALEDVARVLRLSEQKDVEGGKLMRRLTKPRKWRKRERQELEARGVDPDSVLAWHGSREEFLRLFEYCLQDVRTEEAISHSLRDLNPTETEVFVLDGIINERGVQVDVAGVEAALAMVDEVVEELTAELARITGGEVERASQRARLLEWVNARGAGLTDTQGETVDEALRDPDLAWDVRRVLEICRAVNRTSTAKYVAMRNRVLGDGRVRGMFLFNGASTGRWSGAGVQPHNFPRGELKDMDAAWEAIHEADRRWVEVLYDDLMEVLSHATRGALVAGPGRELLVADFSAIESRVLFWLAEDEHALAVFRSGQCIYCDMASAIYRMPVNKKDHPTERQLGKQSILGLGYGMGPPKFTDTCAKNGVVIDPTFAAEVVRVYRKEKYTSVPRLWRRQEQAAIEATLNPGVTVKAGRVSWRVVGRFLHCRLPSGRLLAYCDPRVVKTTTPWGAEADKLTFMAVDGLTRKWRRTDTYGGMLVENIVQAIARDLLAEAMLRAAATETYRDIVLHVHDEIGVEVPEGEGDVKEFERIMSTLPAWADGCPVGAEGFRARRYRK